MKTTAKIVAIAVLALLSACGGVNSRIRRNQDKFHSYPPEAQQKIRNGQIDVGFSKDMVEMALGKPDRVYLRKTESGSQEIWAYTEGGGSAGYILGAAPGGGYSPLDGDIAVETGNHYDEKNRVVFQGDSVCAVEVEKR